MKIVVTTDSTADLTKSILETENIGVIPLIVNLGESEDFYDGQNIKNEDIFEYVKKSGVLPNTAARGSFVYKEFFEKFMKENNADALIHFSLSNELSSSYNNAKQAGDELENVYVIDTRSLSSGSGLLVLSCCDKIKEGKTIKAILDEIRNQINKVQASFVISNLKYLYKGGRCSGIAAFGANLLRIKPKIKLQAGKMCVDRKYMGKFDSVVLKYVEDLLKEYKNIDFRRVFLTYTSEHAELNQDITALLETAGFKNVITNFAGSTIASHCGEDCLGVLFISNVDI